MTARRLIFQVVPSGRYLSTEEFLWRSAGNGDSSFHVSFTPELIEFGHVSPIAQDLVAIAVAVFLSDRTITRRNTWERSIELEIPVQDCDAWNGVRGDLEVMLNVLTSDGWNLTFVQRPEAAPEFGQRPKCDLVSLFSGGADSLCGAIRAISDGTNVILASHWDWGGHSKYQTDLVRRLKERFPNQISHQQMRVARSSKQLTGEKFRNETSRRSRSLLFLALGAAIASVEPTRALWIPENGYASLNVPLAGERLGSLSTRTTHPLFLSQLKTVLNRVGMSTEINNPFVDKTKGEMFAEIGDLMGKTFSSELLSLSHSCAHVRYAKGTGRPPSTQCGICFGCLVRRAAFHAADLADQTTYLHSDIARTQMPNHLLDAGLSEVRTVQYAVERGISQSDLLALGLSEEQSLSDSVALARRGLAELGDLIAAAPDLRDIA